jgi:hypothetical protein
VWKVLTNLHLWTTQRKRHTRDAVLTFPNVCSVCFSPFSTTPEDVNKELTEVCIETDLRLLQEVRQQAEHRFEIARTTCGADIELC